MPSKLEIYISDCFRKQNYINEYFQILSELHNVLCICKVKNKLINLVSCSFSIVLLAFIQLKL